MNTAAAITVQVTRNAFANVTAVSITVGQKVTQIPDAKVYWAGSCISRNLKEI